MTVSGINMKRTCILAGAAFIIFSCNTKSRNTSDTSGKNGFLDTAWEVQKQKALTDTADFTTIQWLDSTFLDMGKVPEGRSVEVTFRFRNSGNRPLVISNVSASCGCTIPEKPEQPFAPGQEGTIRAKFNSQGHVGENNKSVYVNANTKTSTMSELKFHVTVEKGQ